MLYQAEHSWTVDPLHFDEDTSGVNADTADEELLTPSNSDDSQQQLTDADSQQQCLRSAGLCL